MPASDPAEPLSHSTAVSSGLWRGLMFGVVAAVGYTAANVFLRGAADQNSAWVAGMKSLWTFSLFFPWILWLWLRGQSVLPSRPVLWGLVGAALLGQFGGNLTFQMALGIIGLAITVPICLGTMITASAIIGRIWGNQPLKRQVALSIPVFLIAIVLLSAGRMAQQPTADSTVVAKPLSWILLGCGSAAISGVAYSVLGFSIRRCTHDRIPVATPMVVVALVGAVGLGSVGGWQLGWDEIAAIPSRSWLLMSLAGIANAAAFLALTLSLKLLPVLYVHLVNSSQVAMAAVAGALLFAEPITLLIGTGVVLTALGFVVMSRDPESSRRGESRVTRVGPAARYSGVAEEILLQAEAEGELPGGKSLTSGHHEAASEESLAS